MSAKVSDPKCSACGIGNGAALTVDYQCAYCLARALEPEASRYMSGGDLYAKWMREERDHYRETALSAAGTIASLTARAEAAERAIADGQAAYESLNEAYAQAILERDEARALVSETRTVLAAMECPPYSTKCDITDEYVTGCHACGEDITSDEDGEHTWEACARGLRDQRDHFLGLALENGGELADTRIFAARWKALAKALHADQIHTIEDRAGGARWRVAVSRSAQMAAKLAAAEAIADRLAKT